MPSVKVALDNLPADADVDVPYLGKFKNNTTTEVDDHRWYRFVTLQPGASRYADDDVLEISTAQRESDAEAFRQAREADLESLKKDQLEKVGESVGVEDASKKTKAELRESIEKTTGTATPGQQEDK